MQILNQNYLVWFGELAQTFEPGSVFSKSALLALGLWLGILRTRPRGWCQGWAPGQGQLWATRPWLEPRSQGCGQQWHCSGLPVVASGLPQVGEVLTQPLMQEWRGWSHDVDHSETRSCLGEKCPSYHYFPDPLQWTCSCQHHPKHSAGFLQQSLPDPHTHLKCIRFLRI